MKTIKKLASTALLMCALMGTPGISIAGHGLGPGNGTGPVVSIYDGSPITVSGVVTNVGTMGQGLSIDTGSGIITVYGIGPIRYWNSIGITRHTGWGDGSDQWI
ncbi:hypothetical protein DBT_1014 [Dissulfuribacter thermophilus]|uniref:Uncharacterized protein n=1 Tax=Dissulfuribacter thermophilus TaxID=1156395 RepID=A0A1B9F703_9BACT|nr:hypothetical protein [Dissulfuribacter thermophilus]OCC15663.1 hypothetical protein DBT_1014 [Dissulfuribacter thermophilus]